MRGKHGSSSTENRVGVTDHLAVRDDQAPRRDRTELVERGLFATNSVPQAQQHVRRARRATDAGLTVNERGAVTDAFTKRDEPLDILALRREVTVLRGIAMYIVKAQLDAARRVFAQPVGWLDIGIADRHDVPDPADDICLEELRCDIAAANDEVDHASTR